MTRIGSLFLSVSLAAGLAALVGLLGANGLAGSAAADEEGGLVRIGPKPTPREELRLLSSGELPAPAAQLLPVYLETQWNRLSGKDDASTKLKLKTAPLNAKEQAEVAKWFELHPRLRERLLLALDPERDDLRAGARVALTLLHKLPDPYDDGFDRLIVAFATVWDQPAAAIGEISRSPKPMAWEDNFEWLVKNARELGPRFKQIPWRLQVFSAADQISKNERDWAQRLYNHRAGLGAEVYTQLAQDTRKLKGLGGRMDKAQADDTLQNLFKYGGVPEDRAYFAQEVCRAVGVPAAVLTGEANSGIMHHEIAWVDCDEDRFTLHVYDENERERVFNPEAWDACSGKRISADLLRADVRMWSDEDAALRAELFFRVYRDLGKDLKAAPRVNLLKAAIGENPDHREAWQGIADAVVEDRLPRAAATQLWEKLQERFKDAPEVLYGLAVRFAEAFKGDQEQFEFYERASAHFADAGRLDLAAKLRLDEAGFLIAKKMKSEAARAAAEGLKQCAGAGDLSVELAKLLVSLLGEANQIGLAVEPLKTAASKLPVIRRFHVNPHWIELMELLRDVYKETGDESAMLDVELQIGIQERNAAGMMKDNVRK
ncbi:MAG: hypothetical protein HY291_03050 [Planctomycetes bacterium]|nr:hypothetical protein [Planctomycetota bacterium]